MKKNLLTTLFLGLCTTTFCQTIDNSTITTFDLDRYLGKWYEVARYDHAFERNLVGTTAEYSLRDDGMIKVLNSGYLYTLDGKFKESVGKAKLNKNGKPGQLRVSFFGPFYSNYYILDLAPDYSYSVVGSSSPKYLWILSRTPQLKPEVQSKIVKGLQQRGYDTSKLIWVEQEK
ncbi:MAG: lipocalin family protein [Bacteroidaceae bacterium]|nr:lipocalin family protein [Bacteroidaceae bacterium]MBR6601583.1 lipocalin family protein [Bacteroidaceae bacterium]